ncbi:MAG: bifunctional heptose 7-phosphate kinase/heptose 1-phosphate adenyltransferase, partial [Rhizobiaceae bacterium]|nr:bifunctional heptose 7-phosphate kinase/heptose 1-phosphate adenyltransferase [Rhizobiaceae bacterium]
AAVLCALRPVDAVVVFEEDTPLELIAAIRPDVLVKGAEYTVDRIVGADIVTAGGGRVVTARMVDGRSTTSAISRIRALG